MKATEKALRFAEQIALENGPALPPPRCKDGSRPGKRVRQRYIDNCPQFRREEIRDEKEERAQRLAEMDLIPRSPAEKKKKRGRRSREALKHKRMMDARAKTHQDMLDMAMMGLEGKGSTAMGEGRQLGLELELSNLVLSSPPVQEHNKDGLGLEFASLDLSKSPPLVQESTGVIEEKDFLFFLE